MAGLPRFVAFKSLVTGKYLRFDPDFGETHGFLTFSGTDILTPFTRFELKLGSYQPPPATNLFNIRSSYNNKYWSREFNSKYITCEAHQPENDPFKTPSTLFKVELDENVQPKTINISQYRNANTVWELPEYRSEIINLEELLVLPRFVAFIGENDYFLQVQRHDGDNYVVLAGTDISDPSVACEVVPNPDGTIRIKSFHTGNFWYSEPSEGYILAYDEEQENRYEHSCFRAVRVENDIFALYNLGRDKFCKRYTTHIVSTLCANMSSIDGFAYTTVVEHIKSREIYNIRFQEDDARVYNKQKLIMMSEQIVNTDVDDMTTKVGLQAQRKRVSSMNTSVSRKSGTKAKISVDIPTILVINSEFEVSVESHDNYEWGESKETVKKLLFEDIVTVRPHTKTVVSLVGTRAHIDIPFVYSQRDKLMDGSVRIYENMQDGIYTYVDTFNVQTLVEGKALGNED